jgi:hypothetical protein
VERLIVDSVLIAIEPGATSTRRSCLTGAEIAIAAITASESLVGVALADADQRARPPST